MLKVGWRALGYDQRVSEEMALGSGELEKIPRKGTAYRVDEAVGWIARSWEDI